jgi:prefoldin subunit 5
MHRLEVKAREIAAIEAESEALQREIAEVRAALEAFEVADHEE